MNRLSEVLSVVSLGRQVQESNARLEFFITLAAVLIILGLASEYGRSFFVDKVGSRPTPQTISQATGTGTVHARREIQVLETETVAEVGIGPAASGSVTSESTEGERVTTQRPDTAAAARELPEEATLRPVSNISIRPVPSLRDPYPGAYAPIPPSAPPSVDRRSAPGQPHLEAPSSWR